MSQEEVINCLKKNIEPMNRTEIANKLGLSKTTVSVLLKKLVRFNDVLVIELDRFEAEKRYGIKRRLSIYYCE